MEGQKTAPYGSWRSPITSERIARAGIAIGDLWLDGNDAYWLEARPAEGGRCVVVKATPGGAPSDVIPSPFNARSRVHEYGGGAYVVDQGTVYFSHFEDQRIYRRSGEEAPLPITPAAALRYADGVIDRAHHRMICIREDHREAGREARNAIVEVDLSGASEPALLVEGSDFFASPRLSPDGRHLAWISWNHPEMPWTRSQLWLGELDSSGHVAAKRLVAGGEESVFQPEWSPGGRLYFISDRSGWWNLYRLSGHDVEAMLPLDAEMGGPQWTFRPSTYAFLDEERMVCAYGRSGRWHLAFFSPARRHIDPIETPYTEIGQVRAHGNTILFRGGAPHLPVSVVRLDAGSGRLEVLRRALPEALDPVLEGYLSLPQSIEFPTDGGLTAHALFYPPANRDYRAPEGEQPPLLVKSHGGPTSAASASLDLRTQYWTSRGFGVVDVNYGGSTGYGRAYRFRLERRWGIVDVADCVNAARHLVHAGRADGDRLLISGGSAGGYTTLCALTFHHVFRAGASHYGVSDLEALVRDTHKFESRYLDWLIGPHPAESALYKERSPIHAVHRIAVPVAFFQGEDDRVVPPNQTEMMIEALRKKGIPFLYLLFAGEQHGFRKAENIQRALDAELYFYATTVLRTGLAF